MTDEWMDAWMLWREQALASLEVEGKSDWRDWDAFSLMRKLAASCESTYHLMKYLEPDVLRSDAIDAMYSKLVVLMNHLAEELKPMVARQRHFPVHVMDESGENTESGVASGDSLADVAMYGDLGYYAELLDQAAEFFSVRCITGCYCCDNVVTSVVVSLSSLLSLDDSCASR